MKRTIDLDQIRVVQASNYKGNPRVYLEIMDQRVLYSSPYELPAHYVREDEFGREAVDTEACGARIPTGRSITSNPG